MLNLRQYILGIINKIKNKAVIKPVIYKNATTKYSMNADCTLKFSSETEKLRKQIDSDLKSLMKEYINNPERLITYIKSQGIQVYQIKNAQKLLKNIGEEEGFITPLKGIKALILNLILSFKYGKRINIKFKTKEMLIFSEGSIEIYTIARALYKHRSFKNSMPGYDYKSQEIFKKTFRKRNKKKSTLSALNIKEMYACKEAAARDIESIKFTLELAEEFDKYKQAVKSIKEQKKIQI